MVIVTKHRGLASLLAALATLAVTTSTAAPAHAGACCISATAVGTGRLLNWEDAAVGLSVSTAYALGAWDPEATWRAFDDYGEVEVKSTLWGMLRVSSRSTLSLSVPAILNHRWSGDLSATGGFVGDVGLGFRWDPLLVGEYEELPAIALVFGILAPTGRRPGADTGLLAEGATGRGAWVLSAGLVIEKTVVPWFARLEAIANVPLPGDFGPGGASLQFGPGMTAALTGGFAFDSRTTLALTYHALWESSQRIAGKVLDDSGRLSMGLSLSASWRFHDHWTFTSAVDTGIFADGAGDNGFGRISATVGFRYGVF